MSFFSKIFGNKSVSKTKPDIHFGRYSDAYKSDVKYDAWDRAVEKFQARDYLGMYRDFFFYLSDEEEHNLNTSEKNGSIDFELFQGSKKIVGTANSEEFRAEAKIAKVASLQMSLMKRLIEDNYDLKYGRYCIDKQGDISIVFDSLIADGSPYKLYYGLKEIAIAADKRDDLFLEEFKMLSPVNVSHTTPIDEVQKQTKASYLRGVLEETLAEALHGPLNAKHYPGGITYLLLDAVYRLDFLTRPEGYTTEAFERMHRSFFAADGLNIPQKNKALITEMQKILDRPAEKLKAELYRTKSTFGIINATSHQKLKEIIEGELDNMDWYLENDHEKIALSVPGYIVGHALFHYSLPEPDQDLLLLYYQIMEQNYFNDLGFELDLRNERGELNGGEIKNAILLISDLHRVRYPKLLPKVSRLLYDSPAKFAKSFLLLVADLDLNRIR
ncbi:MAG: hypothetical protein OEQ53_22160 [Saprospiraceae bacterium]|nr:hypothetical protein [Saprospiraceae bacterium]